MKQEIKIFNEYLTNISLLEDEIRKFTHLSHIRIIQIHSPILLNGEDRFPQIIIMITFENHA